MADLNSKCQNCAGAVLVTSTFCNISDLPPDEWYYTCIAGVEEECLKGE